METCPTCWQPVPRPQRGDHDYGIPLSAAPVTDAGLREAAVFMLELVDQYYGTDHEFDIPEEAEFRRHRTVIESAS
jgi:hypothetical protein